MAAVDEIPEATAIRLDVTRCNIIIVGAGYAGLRFLAESVGLTLQQKLEDSVGYIIVDGRPRSQFGRGVAWESDQNLHMMTNMHIPEITTDPTSGKTVADTLGVSYDDQPTAGELFARREKVGGIFAQDFLAVEKEALEHGISIDCIEKDEVLDIERVGQSFNVLLRSSLRLTVNFVVLALGHIPPTNYHHLFGKPNYIRNPWAQSRDLERIPNDEKVAVLGLGPTSVDTVIRLRDSGLKEVVAYSRSGTMQYPRPIPAKYKPRVVTPTNVRKVAESIGSLRYHTFSGMLLSEFLVQGVDWQPFLEAIAVSRTAPLDQALRHGYARCNKVSDWFGLITCLTEAIPTVWNLLDDRDRDLFQDLHSQISNVLYGMAPSHALRMSRELEDRSLIVRAGLQSVQVDELTGKFEIKYRKNATIHVDIVDHVVDCSGFGKDITKSETPLIVNLLSRQLLRPHHVGGAIVDFDTGQVARTLDGRSLRIYCLTGSLNIGTRFATNGLGHVASSARRTAREIHSKLDYLAPDAAP